MYAEAEAHRIIHKRNENRFDTILTSFDAVDKNHSGTEFAHMHDGYLAFSEL